jgi:acyl dehydratase
MLRVESFKAMPTPAHYTVVRPHHRFGAEYSLEPERVAQLAAALGDNNPVHRDPQYAANTRYGRPIASGPHTTGLLLGLTATHFSSFGPMVGLEFWVKFKRAIFADETIRVEWLVIRATPNERLRGDVLELRGRVLSFDGRTAVGAKGSVLLQSTAPQTQQ